MSKVYKHKDTYKKKERLVASAFTLSVTAIQKLDYISSQKNVTLSAVVREALEDYFIKNNI